MKFTPIFVEIIKFFWCVLVKIVIKDFPIDSNNKIEISTGRCTAKHRVIDELIRD
jgi:hypothetical protein